MTWPRKCFGGARIPTDHGAGLECREGQSKNLSSLTSSGVPRSAGRSRRAAVSEYADLDIESHSAMEPEGFGLQIRLSGQCSSCDAKCSALSTAGWEWRMLLGHCRVDGWTRSRGFRPPATVACREQCPQTRAVAGALVPKREPSFGEEPETGLDDLGVVELPLAF